MNYFAGFPGKKPKHKQVNSSGTEGTQKSSIFNDSGVTPQFYHCSDDEIFDTPKAPKNKYHNSQDLIQNLVYQNQSRNSNMYGSMFSFEAKNGSSRKKGDIFGVPSLNNCYQHSFDSQQDYSLEKGSRSTIQQVNEEFEGLNCPLDDFSQQLFSQKIPKVQNPQITFQKLQHKNKNKLKDDELRQSIIEVLSCMNSSDSASRTKIEINKENQLGVKEKLSDEDDKNTIIDDLSDLVQSPPKYENQVQKDKLMFRPMAGSQRKGETAGLIPENLHGSSAKTFFEQRNQNKPNLQRNKKNYDLTKPSEEKSILDNRFQGFRKHNSKQKQHRKSRESHSNLVSDQIFESKVAQINLDSIQFYDQDSSENFMIKKGKKQENQRSFFKNKPYNYLNDKNQRKNNLMKNENQKQPKEGSNKLKQNQIQNKQSQNVLQSVSLKSQKPQRKVVFSRLASTKFGIKRQSDFFTHHTSDPLQIEFSFETQQNHTKPFEHHSEMIDTLSEFETKPISYEKVQSKSRFGKFAKINRNEEKQQVGTRRLGEKPQQQFLKVIPQKSKISNEFLKNQPTKVENAEKNEIPISVPSKFNFLRRSSSQKIVQPQKLLKYEEKSPVNTQQSGSSNKVQLQRKVFKFQRRVNDSKISKKSLTSMNSQTSDNGLDMKGILEKVNEKKEIAVKNNFRQNLALEKRPKTILNFKNRINLKLKSEMEQKKHIKSVESDEQKFQIQNKPQRKQKIAGFQRKQENFYGTTFSEKKNERDEKSYERGMTVQKEKPSKNNSTIPKYIFSKKTPPKNPGRIEPNISKKEESIFESMKLSNQNPENRQKDKNAIESKRNLEKGKFLRSNYIMERQKEGFRPENESEKLRRRNSKGDTSDYPSIDSCSGRSDLIKEVANLMKIAVVGKQIMRRRKEASEELLQKTIDLKRRVDEVFTEERIKRLMEWRFL